MKTKMGDKAVAEIISAILLLAMAVVAFSVIYMTVLSDDGPGLESYTTVIGKMEGSDVVFEHNRGEGISTDSTISLIAEGRIPLFQGKISGLPNFTSMEGMENGIWDIGERIVYTPPTEIIPTIFQKKIQIKGELADKRTNSLVFWGVIQEGYVEPEGGKGGIWHLDEGTGSVAYDSSGNNNDGYVFGSKWIPGRKNYALMFNSNPSDYVRIPNGPGLYITDNITVETWICPLDTTSGIIDSYEFDEHATGITWIHISGEVFAFAYWYQGVGVGSNEQILNVVIQTVNLTSYGYIEDNPIDVYHFTYNGSGQANGFDPDFLHINGSVYAIAHRWGSDDGFVTTLNIYENGTIDHDYIDMEEFEPDPSNAFRPDIIHVSGNIYAIASCEFKSSGGNIATVEIGPDGTIPYFDDDIVIDRIEFESENCSHPRMWKVSDNKFIVAYAYIDKINDESRGYVKTIEIENDGSINKTIFDTFEFESTRCFETDLEYINSFNEKNYYAIAYRGKTDNGYITTIEVNNSGTITKNVIDSIKFDPSVYGGQPDIEFLNVSNNTFAVAYLGPENLGYLTTLKILDNGTISNITDTFPFTSYYNRNLEMEPKIVHVSEEIYGICFKGHAGKGYLITVAMSDEGLVEGIEGYGGIFKDNSYALKANATTVFATINNVTINLTGIMANSWNHIALTYNGSVMSVYINNIQYSNKFSYPYPYENKKINFTESDDLYFGYLFYGALDEIAIFDRALSPEEIEYHYENPGAFDYEPDIPPILSISNITSSEITYNSTQITWDTDKPSTSLVRYGTTTSPTDTISDSSLVTSHSIILTGLLPDQTYYYEVESIYDGNTITDNNNGIYHMFITKDVIHVDSIQMSYEPSGSKYKITTEVKIVNNTNEPVNGAKVTIELMFLPDGSKTIIDGTTLNNGIATIIPSTKYSAGNYISTVTNVEKAGCNYEPSYNVETSESLTIT